jgi:transposase-like protein
MDIHDFYWLIGWLEGEGSFIGGSPSQTNRCAIRGSSTDRDTLEKVCRILGTKVYEEKPRRNGKPHWKQVYLTSLEGQKAVDLMLKLKPFMSSRRQSQIDKAISTFEVKKLLITEDLRLKVKTLSQQNLSCRKIAAILNISHGTVSRINNNKI